MSDYANDWVGQTLSSGRYRVDAKLGEGGMGFVYKVWDRNLDTDVVVKAPRPSMLDDPEFASRFALEIRSLVKLTHPNIVKVSDVGEHQGLPFAVMQYLAGGTLDERQEFGRDGQPKPATPSSVAGWLPGMAAALDFIHGKGYIHRDVKPANILFDTHGHPYLSDFGVAKVLSDVEASAKKGPSGMTGIGIVLGTPEYMAPELIMGNKFDGKVDQYALASAAYEILCGRKPFTGETATAILVRQTTQEPPPMVELPSSAAPAISRVILKGMAKKPGDRFGSCVEFANALVAALAKAGVAQPQPGRLACPTCGAGFAATADLANYKGRKSKCKACGAPFRIADDGLSLLRIDPDAMPSPSGDFEVVPSASPSPAHKANRTVKLDAMPSPARVEATMKMEAMPGSARVEKTQKMDAMPGPARVQATMKMEAMPGPSRVERTMKMAALPAVAAEPVDSLDESDLEPEGRSPLPWVIGGIVAVAATAILGIFLATRSPKEPVVEVALAPSPVKVTPPNPKSSETKPIPPASSTPKVTPGPTRSVAVSPPTPPPAFVPPPAQVPTAPVEEEKTALPPPDKPETEVEKHDDPPARPPVKGGQAKEHLTMREILADPKEHLDQLVFPSDLVFVNTDLERLPGNLPVRCKDGPYEVYEKPDSPFQIVLKRELLGQLRQEVNAKVLLEGEYPAIVGMRVTRDPRNPRGYLGEVEWMELLYFIDPRPISGNLKVYKDVYCVVHLSGDGPKTGRSPNFKQWQARVQKLTTTIRNLYDQAGRPATYTEWGRLAGTPAGHAVFFHQWIMGHFRK